MTGEGGKNGEAHTTPNVEKWLGAHTYEYSAIAKLDKLLWALDTNVCCYTLPAAESAFWFFFSGREGKMKNVLLFSLHSFLFSAPYIGAYVCIYMCIDMHA